MKRIDNAPMASFGIELDDFEIENKEKVSESLDKHDDQEFDFQRMP